MKRPYISHTGTNVAEKTFLGLIRKGLIEKSNYTKQIKKIYNNNVVYNQYTGRLNTANTYKNFLKSITAYQNIITYDVYEKFIPSKSPIPVIKWVDRVTNKKYYMTKNEQILKKPFNILPDHKKKETIDEYDIPIDELWLAYMKKHNLRSITYDELYSNYLLSDPQFKKYIKTYPQILDSIEKISGVFIYSIVSIQSEKILTNNLTKNELKNMILFNSYVNIDIKNFINDTCELINENHKNQCVLDCLLYHLKLNDQNKKLTRDKIINHLNINNNDPEQGFNCVQIANMLDSYSCNYKFLDYNQREFLSNSTNNKNKKLPYFIAIIYANHLYYCADKDYIKKFSINANAYPVNVKNYAAELNENDVVIEVDDLTNDFIDLFDEDNTIRKIKTYNNKIVQINIPEDNKNVYANRDYDKINDICNLTGIKFNNQNMTSICQHLFNSFYENHKKSQFFDNITQYFKTNANIVRIFDTEEFEEDIPLPQLKQIAHKKKLCPKLNEIKNNEQQSLDINKCRTACFYDNKLGPYPVFDIYDEIEEYHEGDLSECGWFYIINFDHKYLNNNYWYSGEFLKILKNEFHYNFDIKYKYIASSSLPYDYGKKYVEYIIDNFKPYYKDIINKTIGYFGKTKQINSKGYIEHNYDIAVSNYLQTNIFYSLKDTSTKEKRMRSKNKYNNGEYQEITVSTIKTKNKDLYIVEKTTNKKIFDNDLPLYQKILENEYLRVLQLEKKMGGKLLAIKTDNVITVGGTEKFNLDGIHYKEEDLGGYKIANKINVENLQPNNKNVIDEHHINTMYEWNQIIADENKDHLNNFEELIKKIDLNKNFCVNAMAGYGKSHLARHLPYFNNDTTLILAFTNIAAINLSGATINSTFNVDYNSNDACPNKIKLMKYINHIIIDEFSMIPPYIMKILYQIYKTFPDIRWVFLGDPHQNRPVHFEKVDWFKTRIFIDMCHSNVIVLTKNMRNDLTEYYNNLINGKNIDINHFGSHTHSNINIVKTNEKRIDINKFYMNKYKNDNSIFIKNKKQVTITDPDTNNTRQILIPYHEKQQDVYLSIDTPIMSIINKKKSSKKDINCDNTDIKYVNGERFKIIDLIENKFNRYDIKIGNNMKEFIISEYEFMTNFVVSYAMTNHKCQGITINEPYIIHQWSYMNNREKYTAFSRGTRRKYISIIDDHKYF